MTLSFAAPDRPHWSDQERIDEIHAAPKIGQHFGEQVSDHMAVADWTASEGWTGDAITDYQPLAVNPANAVLHYACLLYTSDAADEGLGVDLGGRRIIKKKKK